MQLTIKKLSILPLCFCFFLTTFCVMFFPFFQSILQLRWNNTNDGIECAHKSTITYYQIHSINNCFEESFRHQWLQAPSASLATLVKSNFGCFLHLWDIKRLSGMKTQMKFFTLIDWTKIIIDKREGTQISRSLFNQSVKVKYTIDLSYDPTFMCMQFL